MYLPIFLDITDWQVLIVGGGEVACRKASTLQSCGAKITVLAPERTAQWDKLEVRWQKGRYCAQNLDGYRLVIAATDDAALNGTIADDCRQRGILCNSVTAPHSGEAIFPGVVRQGGITAALSSQGRTPFLIRKLKEEIVQVLAPYTEEAVELLCAVREDILRRYPENKAQLLQKLAETPVYVLQEKGTYDEITNWLQREQAGTGANESDCAGDSGGQPGTGS